MLIIRSRGAAQELRRLSSNLNAASLWSSHNRSKARDRDGAVTSRRGDRFQENGRSDVAPAPFKFLPDYAEERGIRQRRQWKRFLCLTDGYDRPAFNVDGSAAIQRQVNWIIRVTRFDFDDRSICNNDRAVRENVRANRRDDEHAGLRVENRSPGGQ